MLLLVFKILHHFLILSTRNFTKIIVVRASVRVCIRTGSHGKSFDLKLSFAVCLATEY